MVLSEDVLRARGSVLAVFLLFRLLVSDPVHAFLNGSLVEELEEQPAILCDLSLTSSCKRGWDYGQEIGPETWPGVCASGQHQSPVDLEEEEAKTANWDRLAFFNYKNPAPLKVTNNGHSVVAYVTEDCPRGLGAGGLPGVYNLVSLHFHWNSEHMLSGRRMPLEVHLVHLKNKYKTVYEARDDPEGLAYVAVFFEESRVENAALNPLLEAVKSVSEAPDSSADVADFSLTSLLPGTIDTFYRYHGSLTTPDCDEIVTWTILKSTVPISTQQLGIFMEVKDYQHKKRSANRRPVQALNGRTVFVCKSGTSTALTQVPMLVALALHI